MGEGKAAAPLSGPAHELTQRATHPQEELLKGREKWLKKGLFKAESPQSTPRSTPPPSPLFHFQPQHQPRRASSSSSAVSSPSRPAAEAHSEDEHDSHGSVHSGRGDNDTSCGAASSSHSDAGASEQQHQQHQQDRAMPIDDGFDLNVADEEEEEGYDELDHDLGVLEEASPVLSQSDL